MPGVAGLDQLPPIGNVIEDLLLLAGAGQEGERVGRVRYLPPRRGTRRGRRSRPARWRAPRGRGAPGRSAGGG
jgi:hypothetical protein